MGIDIASVADSLSTVFSLQSLLLIIIGSTLGVLIGALPGLGPTVGTTLLLPVAFALQPTQALIFLIAIYMCAEYGGSITAILISTPGTTAATATVQDGYALTRKGLPGKALGMSIAGSTIGGMMSALVLLLFALPLMNVALSFGPTEYFALGIFGLSLVVSLSGGAKIKGLFMAIFGLLIGTVGIDSVSGVQRFTFGSYYVFDGIELLPALMGLYAVSEVLFMFTSSHSSIDTRKTRTSSSFITFKEFRSRLPVIFQSGIIGSIVGVLPGAGGSIGGWLAYDQSKRIAKDRDQYGRGALSGVAAPETANNATVGGALVPLLSLGIPGSPTTAVLLGALIFHGVSPGPDLLQKSPDIFYSIVVALFVICAVMFSLGYSLRVLWVKLITIRAEILAPVILALAVIGTYAVRNLMFDVFVMLGFGIIGYFLRRFNYPMAPAVLALVLAELIESNMRRALIASDGSWTTFVTHPISGILLCVAMLSFFAPLLRKIVTLSYRRFRPGRLTSSNR